MIGVFSGRFDQICHCIYFLMTRSNLGFISRKKSSSDFSFFRLSLSHEKFIWGVSFRWLRSLKLPPPPCRPPRRFLLQLKLASISNDLKLRWKLSFNFTRLSFFSPLGLLRSSTNIIQTTISCLNLKLGMKGTQKSLKTQCHQPY